MFSLSDRPVLIVDGQNLFVRCYSAFPTMNTNGEAMGGCVGFLKSLRRIVSEIQPSAVIVAWEGGGSARRRALYADYKLNRRPEKLNRFYEDDIPDSDENRRHQLILLLGMVKYIPVCQVYVADCEGDDTIAYLCRGPLKAHQKVIASSDRDFYQLLDNETRIYSLHKKTFVHPEQIFEEFRITAKNFAIAKALCGDKGDNVPGIKGCGFKTAAKLFPFLGTEQEIVLQDVLDFCHSHVSENKLYQKIISEWDDVKRNWRLVFLDGSMLSSSQMARVDHALNTFKPRIDKMGLLKQLVKEGINDFDNEGFFYSFSCIDGVEHGARS